MGLTYIGMGKASLALLGGGITGYLSSGNNTWSTTGVTPTVSPAWTVSTSTNFGTANVWTGFICVAATGVYGIITSNTATALTVDQWYNPATPTGAAGSTPASNTLFWIMPGNAPCWWMGIGTSAGSVAAADTALANEQSTNGLVRSPTTYAHTYSTTVTNTTTTLSNTYTYTGTGAVTLANIGIFDAKSGGVPMFTTAMNATATVTASGDTVTVTETVTV